MRIVIWFLLIFLGVFTTGAAFAATGAALPDDASAIDLIRPVIDAFKGGDYPFAASLSIVLLVALIRRYGTGRIPFFGTERGAALLAFVGSFAGAMSAGLSGDGEFSRHLAFTALNVALGATGGYMAVKAFLIEPLLKSKFYQEKAPAWLKSILGLVLWIFESRKTPPAIARAEEAGEEAVKKDPPTGMGEVKELK